MADASEWAGAAVEQLLGDEGLRGNLEDAGYTPLFEWGVGLIEKRAQTARGQAEVEAFGRKVREAVRAVVQAAEAGKAPDAAALAALDVPGMKQAVQQVRAYKAGPDADENARAMAAVLRKATG